MKISLPLQLSIFFFVLFLCACGGKESHDASETAGPSFAPVFSPTKEPLSIAVVPSDTPQPVTPSPVPTSAPSPTPTPDPYAEGVEVTVVEEGFCYMPLNKAMRQRITGMSYPENDDGLKISYDDLRYLRLTYVDFEGTVHSDGEMIVNKALAEEVLQIFSELYRERYPLSSVRLVDDYGEPGGDNVSMAADNTSCFNYRRVSGSKKLSMHSYGAAIDINPLRNPYIKKNGTVSPAAGAEYADRSRDFPGKIDQNDLCYKVFTKYGWSWGGHFKTEKDYQHFSKDVG